MLDIAYEAAVSGDKKAKKKSTNTRRRTFFSILVPFRDSIVNRGLKAFAYGAPRLWCMRSE